MTEVERHVQISDTWLRVRQDAALAQGGYGILGKGGGACLNSKADLDAYLAIKLNSMPSWRL